MDEEFKILLVGDVMIGRTFNQIFRRDPEHQVKIWGDCLSIMCDHHIVIGNLETTLTNSTSKWPNKTFNYRLNPRWADTLSIGNFGIMSIANNHILDFQTQGLLDTQKTLDQLEIGWAGAGINIQEAQEPRYIQLENMINGVRHRIRLGFLATSDHYEYWEADKNQPGIWYLPILDLGERFYQSKYWKDIEKIVKKTKRNCDYLIFSLHWGPNYTDQVDPLFQKFAHKLIEIGADIIHGHSAHHVLPIERYKQGLIFYSMGDFVDDYAVDPIYRNDLAFMASITLPLRQNNEQIKSNLDYTIYPTKISQYMVNLRK